MHMQALCNATMQSWHWQELAELLGTPVIDPQTISLQQLLVMGLPSHASHLARISDSATVEHAMLRDLKAITERWRVRELRATNSGSHDRELEIAEAVQLDELLVADCQKIDRAQAGPFAGRFDEHIKAARKLLLSVKQLLDCWAGCRCLRAELLSLFQESSLRNQQAQQYSQCQRVLMRLQSILGDLVPGVAMQAVIDKSDMYEVCSCQLA
jgi:hypothetical protein